MGAKPEHVYRAVQYMKKNNLSIGDINSITKVMRSIIASGNKDSVDWEELGYERI